MRIWMAESLMEKNYYARRQIWGVLLISVLGIGATFLLIWLAFQLRWPIAPVSAAACLIVTILLLWAASRLGAKGQKETQIFYQDRQGRLFVVDIRQIVPYRRGFLGYVEMAWQTEKLLEGWKTAIEEGCRNRGIEILAVEKMKLFSRGYRLVCQVGYENGARGRRSFLLQEGYQEEESLLAALEQKMTSRAIMGGKEDMEIGSILISGFILAGMVLFCAACHPAWAILPEKLYFPVLGLTAISAVVFLFLLVKRRRGE